MLLNHLLQGGQTTLMDRMNPEVRRPTADSRSVEAGDVFFAIPGRRVNGRAFVAEAVARGAVAIIAEERLHVPSWVTVGLSSQVRRDFALAAANFYGCPAEKMRLIGVTGTNGKTTTVNLIARMLERAGKKTAVLTTIENRLGEKFWPASLTTPEPMELNRLLSEFASLGAEYTAMEVSSQGLHQERVHGLKFHAKVLTQVTEDHLDYHGTREAYHRVKRDWLLQSPGIRVLNLNDPVGLAVAESLSMCRTFAVENLLANVFAASVMDSRSGLSFELHTGEFSTRLTLPTLCGVFMVENILAAITTAFSLNLPLQAVIDAVREFVPPPGRMSRLPSRHPFDVIVDYAHSEDALRKVLQSLRARSRGKVRLVFGCGGDRDASKRPRMGRVAEELADAVYVTSDNPRFEDPRNIIEGILGGMKRPEGAAVMEDRQKAIDLAIREALADDIVCIAGKGHEDYQEVQGVRYPFSDWNTALDCLSRLPQQEGVSL